MLNSTLISINEHFLTNYTTELDEVDEGRGERERSRRLELTDDDAELDFRSRSLSDMFFLNSFCQKCEGETALAEKFLSPDGAQKQVVLWYFLKSNSNRFCS